MILTFKDGAIINDKNDLNGIGIYEIEVSDSDAYSLREQLKKEHKWKKGDRVRMKGCEFCEDGSTTFIVDYSGHLYCKEYDCCNPNHWELIEESGVRSPEQNPKEIDKLSYELENPMLSIIYKCNELCEAVNRIQKGNS